VACPGVGSAVRYNKRNISSETQDADYKIETEWHDLLGLLVVAALFIFFVILFFKLLPPYLEHAKVKTALENISRQPGTNDMEKAQIKAAFDRRFSIEDVGDMI